MRILVVLIILFGSMTTGYAQTIKIGLAHVFSGPMYTFGEVAEQGASVAIKEINESGGLLGKQLELLKADTAAKPDVGLAAVNDLVTHKKVDVVVGLVSSAVALKVAPEMPKLACPLIVTHAMADAITGSKCNPWVFRMTWSTKQCVKGAALLAQRNAKSKTWITVGPDYGFGQECWELFKQYMNEKGTYEYLEPIFTPLSTTDWNDVGSRLTSSEADGYMISLWGNNLKDFLKQLGKLGTFKDKEVICIVGGGVEVLWPLGFIDLPTGIWFGTPYWQDANDSEENRKFVETYSTSLAKSVRMPPSYSAYTAYAAVKMYAAAVKRSGSIDKNVVAKTLPGLIVDLPAGPTFFRVSDHQAMYPIIFGKSAQPSSLWKRFRDLNPLIKIPAEEVTPSPEDSECRQIGS
ncbi:MAG: ABC transporter substrate-binding protein [Desulfomonilaceae bacterium]|nr:ABC transporter substrate-binding protein [Desulfomonilaceae bacterium]